MEKTITKILDRYYDKISGLDKLNVECAREIIEAIRNNIDKHNIKVNRYNEIRSSKDLINEFISEYPDMHVWQKLGLTNFISWLDKKEKK